MHTSSAAGEKDALTVNVYVDGELRTLEGVGNGPIAAFVNAINELPAGRRRVRRAGARLRRARPVVGRRRDRRGVRRVHRDGPGGDAAVLWGVGLDPNIVTASLKAVISAVNRA